MSRLYSVTASGLTLAADNGDFGLLVGTAGTRAVVHEVRVFQTGVTALAMDVVRLNRGTLGAGGGALTEQRMDPADTTNVLVATSLPTTDVTSDYQVLVGWNLLQEVVWLPTPEQQLILNDGDDLGIGRIGAVAHTGVGFSITWEEFGI